MATLKLAVVPAKALKNGKHKIRIAVSHKQDTRYIVTSALIDHIGQFKDGQVANRPDAGVINKKLRNRLNDYQDVLDSIDPDYFNCSQLCDFLKKNTKIKTILFSAAADEHIETLKNDKSKTSYKYTKQYFIDKFGDIPLSMISPSMISEFGNYLATTKRHSTTTVGIHQRQLKSFITPQINDNKVKYEVNPFSSYSIPESQERELDLTVEEFKLIRDSNYNAKTLRMARDLFCLSYYLGGINLIDLLNINFSKAKTVDYIREKSSRTKKGEKRISLTIQPEALKIIKTWIGSNGKLDFGYKYNYENFRGYLGDQIKRLAKKLGINKRVVYYSARKSLVQHGFELGISLEILEYSIGQSVKKNRPIFNYVRIMRSHADEAMRKIIDSLDKVEKKKK